MKTFYLLILLLCMTYIGVANSKTTVKSDDPSGTHQYDESVYTYLFLVNQKKPNGFFASNLKDNLHTATTMCRAEIIALVTDAKTNGVLIHAEVSILDSQGNEIATQHSDDKGLGFFNVECDTQYMLNVFKPGYETTMFPVSELKGGTFNISMALTPVEAKAVANEEKLNNIYFEFNESHITQNGALQLDKVVSVMNKRPTLRIVVKSHTDNTGGEVYNQRLSERRAEATVQYLISKGISKKRLSPEGMGNSQPLVDCEDNCSEAQDAQNRRSEFLIVAGTY